VQLDVDLAEQTSPDDLPDQPQNQMLSHLDNVSAANVDHGAAYALGGFDDNVVVLGHVKGVERLDLLALPVQHALVNGVGHAVVDQLAQHQPVLALVEHLEGVGREGQAVADVRVACEHGIDVAGELGALVLVDGVGDVGGGALDVNPAAAAAGAAAGAGLVGVAGRRGHAAGGGAGGACVHALLGGRRLPQLRDEIDIVVQLDAARAVQLDLLQGLAHDVVGLVLRLLRRLDDRGLVEIALVVQVELAEGILQPEDLALLELRVFPAPWPSAL
jgi:hypothetical protein